MNITKTFTITANKRVMQRFERFLALLHFNSIFGHSSTFAMPLDGDGEDVFSVYPVPKEYKQDVDLIGGVGLSVEIAYDESYSGANLDVFKANTWVAKDAILYKGGIEYKRALGK